jgi:hypothetical protein
LSDLDHHDLLNLSEDRIAVYLIDEHLHEFKGGMEHREGNFKLLQGIVRNNFEKEIMKLNHLESRETRVVDFAEIDTQIRELEAKRDKALEHLNNNESYYADQIEDAIIIKSR